MAFTSEQVREGFERDFAHFCNQNRRDAINEHSHELVVPGFRARTLCFQNASEPPGWVHPGWYWGSVAVLCGWVYRHILDRHTGVKRHSVVKVFDRK